MRRLHSGVALVIGLSIFVLGCSAGPDAGNTIEGVVVEVAGDISTVETFVILDTEGRNHQFTPEVGLLYHGGPLSHLREHIITGVPVIVTFTTGAEGELIAVDVMDSTRSG